MAMPQPEPDKPPNPEKIFPVSWDQFHRDSRALAWRLAGAGPFALRNCHTLPAASPITSTQRMTAD